MNSDFKVKGKFYPLKHEELLSIAHANLTRFEIIVLYYIRTLDPYSNGIEVNASQIAKDLSTEGKEVHRQTVSRALKKLDAQDYIDLEIIRAVVKLSGKGELVCTDTDGVYRHHEESTDTIGYEETPSGVYRHQAVCTDTTDIYKERARAEDLKNKDLKNECDSRFFKEKNSAEFDGLNGLTSSSESKELIAPRDNKTIDTQSSAYKLEQRLKSRTGYKLPKYRVGTGMNGIKAEFVEWLQSSYMPSTDYWKGRQIEPIDAKKWVTNREEKGLQEEVEARYEQMLSKQQSQQPQNSEQTPLTPEQEAWVAIAREVAVISEGAYIDINPHREFWRVTSNLNSISSGWLHDVMDRVPLSSLPTKLKLWYPDCYRNALKKFPRLRLPAPLSPIDRAS